MSRKPRRKGATRAEFAAHVGLTVQRIGQMIASGMVPLHPDGSIDQDAARLAYIDGLRSGVGRSDSAQRVNDIRAEALRFKLEREKGEWMPAKEIHDGFVFFYQELVAALVGLPAAATRDLEIRKNIETYLGFACDRFRARLNELAKGSFPEDGGTDAEEE